MTCRAALYTRSAADQSTNIAATTEFVEPKAMPTGPVMVDAVLQGGLEAESALVRHLLRHQGLELDESRPQLDEMGEAAEAAAGAWVYIVGHTDNQGSLRPPAALAAAVAGGGAALAGAPTRSTPSARGARRGEPRRWRAAATTAGRATDGWELVASRLRSPAAAGSGTIPSAAATHPQVHDARRRRRRAAGLRVELTVPAPPDHGHRIPARRPAAAGHSARPRW